MCVCVCVCVRACVYVCMCVNERIENHTMVSNMRERKFEIFQLVSRDKIAGNPHSNVFLRYGKFA